MEDNKRSGGIYKGVTFIVLFVFSIVIHTLINNAHCYYDDAVYWNLGKTCGWNVKNLDWGFRGWLLPYIFSMCYKFGMMFGSEFLGYRIFSSIVFALFFSVLYKYVLEMLEMKLSEKKSLLVGGVCGVLFFLFFRGLLIYTLSDFYALILSVLAIIMLYQVVSYEQRLFTKALKALVFGLCLYGAYNIRTIYLFLLIVSVLVLLVWQLCERKWIQMIVTLPTTLAGIVVSSIPQTLMNHHLLKNYSMAVPTEGLMLSQLQWGIYAGRYATFVGDKSQYANERMFFIDKIGQTILEKEQITEFASYGEYFKLIMKYPLDFIGIYIRHLLNMLYPIYPNQYIQNIEKEKSVLLWFFYTILFVAIFYFIYSFKPKSRRWIWMILMLVPCICILPGAVEIRFFIGLHLIIYTYALLGIKDFVIKFRDNKLKYFAIYVIGFFLYVAYAGTLLASTKDGITIING